eukprot:55996-Eustigmatos_ZCMA.PRE.1
MSKVKHNYIQYKRMILATGLTARVIEGESTAAESGDYGCLCPSTRGLLRLRRGAAEQLRSVLYRSLAPPLRSWRRRQPPSHGR